VRQLFPATNLLPSTRETNQIVEHSSDNKVGRWDESPNTYLIDGKEKQMLLVVEL